MITNECAVDESEVDYKIKGDPRSALTAADLAAQTAVVDALERAWPGLQIVGEEDLACSVDSDASAGNVCASELLAGTEDSNALRRDLCKELEERTAPLKDICVFVDPLDGTREFVEGRVWNVQTLVGISVCGESVAGAVGLPFASGSSDSDAAVVYALVGSGPPRVYGERAEPTDPVHGGGIPTDGERPLLVAGDVNDSALAAMYASTLSDGGRNVLLGGTGQKCLAVAEGRADVAIMNFKSSSWDTCAPEALVRASGGELTDIFGEKIVYRPEPLSDDPAGYLNACGVIASSSAFVKKHLDVCEGMRGNADAISRLEAWGLKEAASSDRDEVERVLRSRKSKLLDGLASSDSDAPTSKATAARAAAVMMMEVEGPPPSLAEVLSSNDGNLVPDAELTCVLLAAANACDEIAKSLRTLSLASTSAKGGTVNVQGETQKGMDVIANDLFTSALTGHVAAMASEEEEVVIEGMKNRKYEIAFDPLDGSSNLDTNLPTGSIFGIFQHTPDQPFTGSGRQKIVAAGYALYSASTELVLSLAGGSVAMGFTYDPSRREFVLSRKSIECPSRGPYYSLNDAREPDWPDGLRRWVSDAKTGSVPSGTKFSSRYVCALVADVHRTLLRGGWAGNPRPHLRLLYEAIPLAHIAEACGGKASDGVMDILEILPIGLHDRLPVFIGSKEDVSELVSYGDVQQGATSYSSDDTPVGLASLQRMLGLTDKFWQKMRRNVPEVDEYVRGGPGAASGWANLRELQARVGLSDKELKAAVQRLPQLLGHDYATEVAPPLERLQETLGLDQAQLKTIVTKLPQMLGLDYDKEIEPKLEALRVEDGGTLSDAELRAKLLAKPSALDIAVRGGFKTKERV